MLRRLAISVFAAALLNSGCAVLDLSCDDYTSKDDVLNSWLGANLVDYERRNGRRPFETAVRPQNRTEYSYVAHDEWIESTHYECIERLVVDNATGEIVDWSYEGNYCVGFCNS